MTAPLQPARLFLSDVLRVGGAGLRTRPMRAFLSALGIAIGIAAMTAVVGISSSSRAELDRQLAALGTNMLTVAPGNDLFGETAYLPDEAVSMISRIGPVTDVAATGKITGTHVYRSDQIPVAQTSAISVSRASAPRITFSRTVKLSTSMKCWCTIPMPAAIAAWLSLMLTGLPSTRISPASAW